MSIRYLIEDIKDFERDVRNLKTDVEFYQSQVKLYKHQAKLESDNNWYKQLMTTFLTDYTKKYVESRSNLVTAERNLRVAKLRLKKYLEEV